MKKKIYKTSRLRFNDHVNRMNRMAKTKETKMKILNIKSYHGSLGSAVAEAKPDLSYNEDSAKCSVRDIDRNCRRAFVTEGGDIYYIYSCGIEILHKFEPFHSVISDSPFHPAFIYGGQILIGSLTIPKTKAGRNWFKTVGRSIDALAA